jgi:hypothetical protein
MSSPPNKRKRTEDKEPSNEDEMGVEVICISSHGSFNVSVSNESYNFDRFKLEQLEKLFVLEIASRTCPNILSTPHANLICKSISDLIRHHENVTIEEIKDIVETLYNNNDKNYIKKLFKSEYKKYIHSTVTEYKNERFKLHMYVEGDFVPSKTYSKLEKNIESDYDWKIISLIEGYNYAEDYERMDNTYEIDTYTLLSDIEARGFKVALLIDQSCGAVHELNSELRKLYKTENVNNESLVNVENRRKRILNENSNTDIVEEQDKQTKINCKLSLQKLKQKGGRKRRTRQNRKRKHNKTRRNTKKMKPNGKVRGRGRSPK